MSLNLIYEKYSILLFSMIILGLISLVFIQKAKLKFMRNRFHGVQNLYKAMNQDNGLEQNLTAILDVIGHYVEAPTYAFYALGEKNKKMVLKAVRYRSQDFGPVRPSYSGLAAYQSGSYMPPLSVTVFFTSEDIEVVREGEIPLLMIPVGKRGIIRIGPLESVNKRTRELLESMREPMKHVVDGLIVSEQMHNQSDIAISSGKALQQISNIALDWKVTVETMIKLCIQTLEASGGCIVERQGERNLISVKIGENQDALVKLNNDSDTLEFFRSVIQNEESFFISREDQSFYRLPPFFAAAGIEGLLVVKLDHSANSFLLFWYEEIDKVKQQFEASTLRTIIDTIRGIISYQSTLRQFSGAYVEILKMLSRLIDNLSPYTVGYSEQMSRYSIVIARELGLEDHDIRDIALAAYLNNIGVLGLSSELYQKEGKYTDEDYELMKLHAEVGASIVAIATGNERAASYIMHHHERIDGNGYPSGLKGDEIPVGARIISVVQTFLAKINGRKYRSPLEFNQALQMLKAASGSQLDKQIVEIFIQWFFKKRQDSLYAGRSLGACWEMCCTPKSICEACPAYARTDVNCWEVDGNHCMGHGKSCDTCFVKTEYFNRAEKNK